MSSTSPVVRTAPGILPYLLLTVAGLVWGITFSLAKIAAELGAHPLGLTFWQAAIGLVVLGGYCLITQVRQKTDAGFWLRALMIAMCGTVLPTTFYFYAAKKLPVGILSITIAMVPIVTYGASLALGADQYQRKRMFGLALGFVGMILLAHPEALPDRTMIPWLVLAVLCALCYTVENLFVDNVVPRDTDMAALLTASMFLAVAMLTPVIIGLNVFVPLSFTPGPLEIAVVAMGLITSFAYLIFLYLIQSSGAVFASMMAYVVTISGVGWGMLIFDERHPPIVWLVLLLMVIGMVLVTPLNKSQEAAIE